MSAAVEAKATLAGLLKLRTVVATHPHCAADHLPAALAISESVAQSSGDYVRSDARIMSDALLAVCCRSLKMTELYAHLEAARVMVPVVETALYRAARAAEARA